MNIRYYEAKKLFIIETDSMAYVMGIYKDDSLKHVYWGEKLLRDDDYPDLSLYIDRSWWTWDDEYPCRGQANFVEPAIKATFFDNVRDIILKYSKFEIKENLLVITLKDMYYRIEAQLFYKIIPESDLIERWVKIINHGNDHINIESLSSATWYVPDGKYRLTHLHGLWAHETRIVQEDITEGKKILESRIGQTGVFTNPYFAIDDNATEEYGKVWFGQIGWSGNWKIVVHRQMYEKIAITGGINDFDFRYYLESGESITTPVFTCGYTNKGFGEASRHLHDYQLNHIMPKDKSQSIRKVLYNSWEATYFEVNIENQMKLAEKAASIGVELFVMDDGWFGKRNSDKAGLGDWNTNPDKFPNGLKPLIDHVKSLGMEFGLWVEPEMTNPDSDLYREHPDWVYSFPNRPKTEWRNQLILNLSKKEVRDFIKNFMDKLLSENEISFIKWDMNRPVLESGWSEAPVEKQREIWFRHVEGLYEIWDHLRKKFPKVTFESCSGGGGRVDIGILRYADQFWPSDNTDPFDRQIIQEGFSYAYAPKTMMCWVTDWAGKETYPISYRFDVSMMGSLGIGSNLNHYTEADLELCRIKIEQYKKIRHIVQNGRQYRLLSPRNDFITAINYVTKDKKEAVMFVIKNPAQLNMFRYKNIQFKGLDEQSVYQISGTEQKYSGRALMESGIIIHFDKHFDSKVIHINRVE